jgi:type II secretory pathway component PulF
MERNMQNTEFCQVFTKYWYIVVIFVVIIIMGSYLFYRRQVKKIIESSRLDAIMMTKDMDLEAAQLERDAR